MEAGAGVGRTGPSLSDTWIWDGTEWRMSDAAGPSGRDHHRAVYDRGRDRLVLFGGWDGELVVADTWEWDGLKWHHAECARPNATRSVRDGLRRSPASRRFDGRSGSRANVLRHVDVGWVYVDPSCTSTGPALAGSMPWRMTLKTRGSYYSPAETAIASSTISGTGTANNGDVLRTVVRSVEASYASAYDRLHHAFIIHGSGDRVEERWELEPNVVELDRECGLAHRRQPTMMLSVTASHAKVVYKCA